MPGEAELIMFGIQAALRINQQFRHAYADSMRSRAITLPLPNFPQALDRSSMETFYRFGDGREFAGTNLRVRELLSKLSQAGDLTPEENQELAQLFQEHSAMIRARGPGLVSPGENAAGITDEDIVHLVTIRQWREGQDPNPTMLRRMAGTLVNIAVDYFVEMPGALSTSTMRGQALRSFLESFEGIDFATDGRAQILEGLFVATLERLRDHPEVISEDERARTLVHALAKGIYEDSKRLLSAPAQTLSDKERVRDWSQMVFSSVLSCARATVFAQPEKFLGITGAAQADLVNGVGKAVLTSILSGDGVDLTLLFTRGSLDRVVKAALVAVGNHPELVRADSPFLKELIGATATELAHSASRLGSDFLPEAIRLILDNTAENLELLMPEGRDQPAKHLLIVGVKGVLEQLAAPAPAGTGWTVGFGPAEALHVMEIVIEELVQNPGWLEKKTGDAHPLLREVTGEVLDTLRRAASPRLRRQTGLAILEAALRAAGRRLEFLDKDQENRRLIALAVEAVLGSIFRPGVDARAAWVLGRDATVERLVRVALEQLERHGVSVGKIAATRNVIEETMQRLAQGGIWSWDDLTLRLERGLA